MAKNRGVPNFSSNTLCCPFCAPSSGLQSITEVSFVNKVTVKSNGIFSE